MQYKSQNINTYFHAGFIEFIVSPSLEVCGDVLDRVSMQICEANARPVLPQCQKANSIMFPTAAQSGSQSACGLRNNNNSSKNTCNKDDETRTRRDIESKSENIIIKHETKSPESESSTSTSTNSPVNKHQQQQPAPISPPAADSLASNLRKMIVSSSATIGRKLGNIGVAASISSANSISGLTKQKTNDSPAQQSSIQPTKQPQIQVTTKTDYELRRADYKHPVIRPDSADRPKSSLPSFMRQQSATTSGNSQQQQPQLQQSDRSLNDSNDNDKQPKTASGALQLDHRQNDNRIGELTTRTRLV